MGACVVSTAPSTERTDESGSPVAVGRIPCTDWDCTREHEILRTGPAFASFHPVDTEAGRHTDESDSDGVLIAAAEATLPECAECGEGIYLIQFVAHQVQRFCFEFNDNGTAGIDLDAYSVEHMTLDVEPVYETYTGTFVGETGMRWGMERAAVRVECRHGHTWLEPRLRLKKQSSGTADWEILPERKS